MHFRDSHRSEGKGSAHLWKTTWDLWSESPLNPLWMFLKSACFSLAQMSHQSTCSRKLKAEAGTSIHNSHCRGERIGGKGLKGTFCVSGENWKVSASHPQPNPTRTTSLLQTNTLQHSFLMGCIHKCQPLKTRSAERQGFLSLSLTPHANFPPLQSASKPTLGILLLQTFYLKIAL